MDLNELKTAWNSFSSRDANQHQLDEEAIRDLLKKRTRNLVEKVERNIKIGFAVLFFVLLFLLLDSKLVPLSMPKGYAIPPWLDWLNWMNVILLGGSFVYFWIRYISIKKYYSQITNLRDVLNRTIKTLQIYKVLFNVALFIFLTVATVEFITGMYAGAAISAEIQGGHFSDLNSQQLFWAILKGAAVLVGIVTILFLFFRWGFNRLYGKYLAGLKATLKELDGIG